MWVVKVGGSLQFEPALAPALAALADAAPGRAVVVPGGGAHADVVRRLQRCWRFDDGAAHDLALGAMDQYGAALAAIEPRLRPCDDEAAIMAALAAGAVALWRPAGRLAGASGLPRTWSLSSDSLAAWLAGRLEAEALLLLKAAPAPAGEVTAAGLAAAGLVDPLFPDFLAEAGVPCGYLEARRHSALAAIVAGGAPIPVRVASAGEHPSEAGAP